MPNQQQIQQVIQQAQRLANDLRSLANQSPDRVSRDSLTEGAHHLEMCVRECEHTSQRVQQGQGMVGQGTQTTFGTTGFGQQQWQPSTSVSASGYGQTYGQTGQTYGQTGQTYGQTGQTYGQTGQTGQTWGGYGQQTGQTYGGYGQTGSQPFQTQR